MLGGRTLTNSLRNGGSTWKHLSCQNSWSSSFSSSSRAFSSFRLVQEKTSGKSAPTLTSNTRRFFRTGHEEGGASSSSAKPFFSSALYTAFGVLLGLGGGAAYKFGLKNNTALCAGALDKCGKKDDCKEKKCEDSPCLRKNDCEEELIMKANQDLEKALKDVKGKAVQFVEDAMKAYCEAIPLICEYLNHGYCVIDNDEMESPQYEEAWCCVFDLAKKRCKKVREAVEKGQCAWELLCRLREVIENGRACRYTSCNPLLVTAEEALICAERELLTLKAKMDCVTTEHEMAEQYKDVIESFKADLKDDVEKQIAEMECCDIKYAEQIVAMMILEAYRKVVKAQKDMAQTLVCSGKVPERQARTCC